MFRKCSSNKLRWQYALSAQRSARHAPPPAASLATRARARARACPAAPGGAQWTRHAAPVVGGGQVGAGSSAPRRARHRARTTAPRHCPLRLYHARIPARPRPQPAWHRQVGRSRRPPDAPSKTPRPPRAAPHTRPSRHQKRLRPWFSTLQRLKGRTRAPCSPAARALDPVNGCKRCDLYRYRWGSQITARTLMISKSDGKHYVTTGIHRSRFARLLPRLPSIQQLRLRLADLPSARRAWSRTAYGMKRPGHPLPPPGCPCLGWVPGTAALPRRIDPHCAAHRTHATLVAPVSTPAGGRPARAPALPQRPSIVARIRDALAECAARRTALRSVIYIALDLAPGRSIPTATPQLDSRIHGLSG